MPHSFTDEIAGTLRYSQSPWGFLLAVYSTLGNRRDIAFSFGSIAVRSSIKPSKVGGLVRN